MYIGGYVEKKLKGPKKTQPVSNEQLPGQARQFISKKPDSWMLYETAHILTGRSPHTEEDLEQRIRKHPGETISVSLAGLQEENRATRLNAAALLNVVLELGIDITPAIFEVWKALADGDDALRNNSCLVLTKHYMGKGQPDVVRGFLESDDLVIQRSALHTIARSVKLHGTDVSDYMLHLIAHSVSTDPEVHVLTFSILKDAAIQGNDEAAAHISWTSSNPSPYA